MTNPLRTKKRSTAGQPGKAKAFGQMMGHDCEGRDTPDAIQRDVVLPHMILPGRTDLIGMVPGQIIEPKKDR